MRFAPAAWTRANQVDDAVGRACVQGADPRGRQDLLDGDQKRAGSLKELIKYSVELRDLAAGARLSGAIVHVLDGLIGQPMLTARSLADQYGMTPQTAYSVIDRLSNMDVLRELTGRTYGWVFAATRVLEIVMT